MGRSPKVVDPILEIRSLSFFIWTFLENKCFLSDTMSFGCNKNAIFLTGIFVLHIKREKGLNGWRIFLRSKKVTIVTTKSYEMTTSSPLPSSSCLFQPRHAIETKDFRLKMHFEFRSVETISDIHNINNWSTYKKPLIKLSVCRTCDMHRRFIFIEFIYTVYCWPKLQEA